MTAHEEYMAAAERHRAACEKEDAARALMDDATKALRAAERTYRRRLRAVRQLTWLRHAAYEEFCQLRYAIKTPAGTPETASPVHSYEEFLALAHALRSGAPQLPSTGDPPGWTRQSGPSSGQPPS